MENNVNDSKLLTLKEVHISKEEFDQKYKIYKKHFEDSLENPEYTNIAITGDYGIGKSTIFKSFLKNNDKYKDKYIEVIIGNYYKDPKGDLATTVLLEKQIINQLVSQVDPTKIPLSKYKLSFNQVNWKLIAWLLLIFVLSTVIIGINIFWDKFPSVGKLDWLKFLIISGLSMLLFILLIWKIKTIINYAYKIILKFKLANLEVRMEVNKLSEFDNNLAELIYIFSKCEKNIFVFEDLDRFGNNLIFQKLRELNLIINKYLHNNIDNEFTHHQKINFIYLVKPDLFEKQDDFIKFFDISIPIIPIVNNFDSINYFKQLFGEEYWDNNWNFRLLVRSTHKLFNSVREIHNLHNEFIIYWEQNKNEHYSDYTSVLSFLILKNKFPETFKKLLNPQSKLFQENVKKPLIIIQHRNEILNKLNRWFESIWAILEKNLTQNEKTNKILRYSVFSSLWYNSPSDRKVYCAECKHSYNFYEFYNYCIYMQNPFVSQEFLDTNLEKDDKYNNYVKNIYNKNDFFKLLENQGTNIASFLKYGSSEKIKKIEKRFSFLLPEELIKEELQSPHKIEPLEINLDILESFDNYEYDRISLIFAISKILNEQKENESNLNKLIKRIFEIDQTPWGDDRLSKYYRFLIKLFWLVENEVKIKFIKEILNWKNLEQMIDALDNDSLFNFFSFIYDSRFFPKVLNEDKVEIKELWQKIQKERKMESCSHPYVNFDRY